MKEQLFELCNAIDMPQSVTDEILSISSTLDLAVLKPVFELLFSSDTWNDGLTQLKQLLREDKLGLKMLTCMLICGLKTREMYQQSGLSDSVFLATMDCFPRFVKEHMVSFGCYGFDRDFWTVRQLSCMLFRIGLLEYELSDDCIWLHIPTGAKLIPAEIDASLQSARDFIRIHFSDWENLPWKCHSWLLSPTLRSLLKENSRIRQFQDRFSITPLRETSDDFLMWAFQNDTLPVHQLPEKTSLQRDLKAFLLQGGVFQDAKGVLF